LNWGRWLALGTSFIGFTLGALMLLCFIGLAVFAMTGAKALLSGVAAGGVGMMIGAVFLFFFAAFVVGVVINFKLFMHLISDAGKDEFGAPESSSLATVVASSAVWICVVVLSIGSSSSGRLLTSAFSQGFASGMANGDGRRSTQRTEMERELERRRAEATSARLVAERNNERIRAAQEAERLEAQRNADYEQKIQAVEVASRERAAENAKDESDDASDDKSTSANKILKCQDSSGGVSYTQGYCPPGTKQVAAPKYD